MRGFGGMLGQLALLGSLVLPAGGAGAASELDREVLESLRRRGDISQERYEELRGQLEAESASDWSFEWRNGFQLRKGDGSAKLKFGGRIQNDWYVQSVDGSAKRPTAMGGIGADDGDGPRFRRARLFFEGTVYERVVFKSQFDFAGGDEVDFKDVWLGLQDLPGDSRIRVGHFKEPFSLEEQTSSKYLTFLERSLVNTFSPSRNTGIALNGTCGEDCFTWAVGAFRETDDDGAPDGFGSGGAYSLTTRLTAVPWSDEEKHRLLHVGGSYSHQFRDPDDGLRYRARPGISVGSRFVDTGSMRVDDVDLLGGELAFVCGPFHAQTEYVHSFVDHDDGRDMDFYGVTGQLGFFLTGETRSYKRSAGAFDRTKPRHPFDPAAGHWGAFEIAARVDHLDLQEGESARAGELLDVSGALNWILFPNLRVMTNYVFGRTDAGERSHVAQMRFQVDF